MISKRHVVIAALVAAIAPLTAAAQQADDAVDQQRPQGSSSGPMTVEQLHRGWLIAPDAKVTRVDHATSGLVGAYGGWVADENFFFGAGVYTLANQNRNRGMTYGGFVFQWLNGADKPVGFSLKALLGGGEATLTDTFTETIPVFPPRASTAPVAFTTQTIQARVRQQFFVAEPEANVLLRLGRNLHLTVGAGYRFIGTDRYNPDSNRLQGATGTVGLQIGGGGS